MTASAVCRKATNWLLLFAALTAPGLTRGDEPAPAASPAAEPNPTPAVDPLHVRIDRLVETSAGPFAPIAGDEEFLRRISLDLTGLPPLPEEVRAFVADADPAKRVKAIDRLLASPWYARHLSNVLDVMFMERRANTHITDDEWRGYLVTSVRQNKPYNVLARELLSADGTDPATRPAARFFLDRTIEKAVEPNLMARDIGRIFFGRDMQCAQCHDHPQIDDYKQADYQGLLAIVQGTTTFTAPAPDGKIYLAEKPGTEIAFESVFIKGESHTTGPRVPGAAEMSEPAFHPGDEYTTAPAEGVRPVPKFSRRSALAEQATDGSNRWFNENAANRFWAMMMGRGLVNPPDLHHSANPPSHPELMRLLGEEFARSGFDVKSLLRELALTRTYQRSIDLSIDATPDELAKQQEELAKRADVLEAISGESLAAHGETIDAWQAAVDAAAPLKTEVTAATTAATEALKARDAATAALNESKAALAARQDVVAAVAEATAKTQAAAAKLPQDAEFTALSQKIAEKQAALTAEVTTLAQAVEAKQAAATQAEAALVASRQALDAARAKYAPLAQAIQAADDTMSIARQKMIDDATLAAGLSEQVGALKRLAEFQAAREVATAAVAAIPAAEAQLAAARKAVEEQTALVAQAEQQVAAAKLQLTEVQQQRSAAEQEAAKRKAISDSLAAAVAQATSASGQLPEDIALAEAVKTLQTKAQESSARLTEMADPLAKTQAAEQQATAAMATAEKSFQMIVAEQTRRQQAAAVAEQSLASSQAAATSSQAAAEAARSVVVQDRVASFASASLKPLTPEQLCFATFRVTGIYANYRNTEEAALNMAAPLPAEATPEQIAARQIELEQKTFDKLKGNVALFANLYAAGAGQPQGDFFATADQALFAANGGTLTSWLNPGGGNLAERMINQPDPKLAAEDLYLTILSRGPTDIETAEVAAYLAARPNEKPACVQELAWALLTSAEFRFNH